jgi:hypothetical protein
MEASAPAERQSALHCDEDNSDYGDVAELEPLTKKRRGRPPGTAEETEAISWSVSMVESLLHAREAHRAMFLEARNKNRLALGWARVTVSFNNTTGMEVTTEKIKSKYNSLKSTFQKLTADNQVTGNVKGKTKPAHWDALVSHFGGKEGLAHESLNAENSADSNLAERTSDALESGSSKFEARSSRKRNAAVAETLAEIGSEIKAGLGALGKHIEAGLSTSVTAPDTSSVTQLTKKMTEQAVETRELLATQAEVAAAQTKELEETNRLLRSLVESMHKRGF